MEQLEIGLTPAEFEDFIQHRKLTVRTDRHIIRIVEEKGEI